MLIQEEDYLEHIGTLGMHWGHRKATLANVHSLVTKNEKLKTKLETTITKSEKNKAKIDKYTKRLQKQGGYLTEIGYAMSRNTGRKLGRTLHKDKNINKQLNKMKTQLESNQQFIKSMKTQMKDLNPKNVSLGKEVLNSAFK